MAEPIIQANPIFDVQRAADRATYDHGWLVTSHSFSFAEYFDPRNVNWGALRVLNDDRVAAGQGFGTHPHENMEIVTYVLSGELEHRDSLGSHGVVGPGGVQYMSAGTGVRHSEFNHSTVNPLHFLQMWVLPGRLNEKPLYGQMQFERSQRLDTWLPVASGRADSSAPVRLTQDATMLVSRLESAALEYTFEPGRLGFLFLAEGEVTAQPRGMATADPPGPANLHGGDAVRIAGEAGFSLTGTGEVVLWDVPRIHDGANDD